MFKATIIDEHNRRCSFQAYTLEILFSFLNPIIDCCKKNNIKYTMSTNY